MSVQIPVAANEIETYACQQLRWGGLLCSQAFANVVETSAWVDTSWLRDVHAQQVVTSKSNDKGRCSFSQCVGKSGFDSIKC